MTQEHSNSPKWLKRTQEKSWEAEILLSGIVLFALMQIPGMMEQIEHFFYIKLKNPNYYLIPSEFFGIAIEVLISGFIIHLIFRGIWVGFVGLSYVYPEGADIYNLKFRNKYKRRLYRMPTPIKSVLKLEKICSLTFSTALLLSGYVIGFMIFLSLLVIIVEGFNQSSFLSYIVPIYLILSVIYFIDFITGGSLKRISWLTPFFYPIYRFFSIITLSFLYKNIYYTIITHTKKRKIVLGAIVYIIAFLMVSAIIDMKDNQDNTQSAILTGLFEENRKNANAYENLHGDQFIGKASIQSDVIKNDFLRLFIVHKASFDKLLEGETEMDWSELPYKELNRYFNKLYTVQINDSVYKNIKWRSYVHPQTNEHGITAILNIEELHHGNHEVTVSIPREKPDEGRKKSMVLVIERINTIKEQTVKDSLEIYTKIPFYKTP
jgi:hypothetical protein